MVILTILTTLALCSAAAHARLYPFFSPNNDVAERPWDYLMFVQRWPPSVCDGMAHNQCQIPAKISDWAIHGLWPNYNDGTWPQFCDKQDKFDVSKIESYRAKLEQEWPNLEHGKTEESLWAHEWEKHGTCAKTLPTLADEQMYFQHSLDLINNYHIGNALAKNHITPSNSRSYTKAQIEQALRDNIGNGTDLFDLACVRGELPRASSNNNNNGLLQYGNNKKVALLLEARACVDKQLTIMSCPASAVRSRRAVFDFMSIMAPGPVLIERGGSINDVDFSLADDGCPSDGIYIPTFEH